MMLVQCISSRHFMRDEKFHVVLCSPRTRYWRRHWVSWTIIRNVLGHVPQLFTHIWCGDCQFKIGFYASCSTFLATSVCLPSVTVVHRTQAVEIFGTVSTACGTLPSIDIHGKFYGDRPRETPPSGQLNARGVAKYSDVGPIEGYIPETVQDRR